MLTPSRHESRIRFPGLRFQRAATLDWQRDVRQHRAQHRLIGLAVKTAIETAGLYIWKPFKGAFDQRHRDVDISAFPLQRPVQDETAGFFHDRQRHAEFYRHARFAFRNPPRIRFEDRKQLFRVRYRLVIQHPAFHLVAKRCHGL